MIDLAIDAVDVSIIICTRNRCNDLRETLDSIVQTHVPRGINVELIVVDNGSTDSTKLVVSQTRFDGRSVRYVFEPRAGLSFARNTGVQSANGKAILFTDDDVRVPHRWIEFMCNPILNGTADAVSGGVQTAQHLRRNWMKEGILIWMDLVTDPRPNETPPLIGANCAYSHHVFAQIPDFDTELGAGGRLGLGEDALFEHQLKAAGYKIVSRAMQTTVVHHFDAKRLSRSSLIKRSKDQGRTDAYILYHWRHTEPKAVRLRLLYRLFRLWMSRAKYIFGRPPVEGLTREESEAIKRVEAYRGLLIEKRGTRRYLKNGLFKNTADGRQLFTEYGVTVPRS